MNEKDFACQDYVDNSSPSTFKNDSTCLLMAYYESFSLSWFVVNTDMSLLSVFVIFKFV